MKKILFLFAFVLSASLVSAQSTDAKKSCSKTCAKTCASKKASSASIDGETKVASAESAAELAAANDESIERKVCDVTGSVSYYRKTTCEHSGAVKMTEVEYDETAGSFVNASPKDVMSEGEAKAVKTSDKAVKACCAKGEEKACCASKAKSCSSKKTGA